MPVPRSASVIFFASVLAVAAQAQVVTVPPTPQVGSSNPVSPEPPIVRPATKPCTVPLLTNQAFANFNGKPLNYTPPAACPGPWAKVVLTADFTVTAGRQYDRTAEFYLGNANIFYGTTSEPRRALSPSWHVERDLTDLSALFKTPQTGQAEIGNLVDSTYTGIIYVNAALQFYPVSAKAPAAVVPDMVVPITNGNDAMALNTGTNQIAKTLALPRNVEKVYLDVIAQSQSNDEQWFLCVPNDQTGPLESCGNTGFRETEITVDGKAAGIAPVYPWIYTGGLDPYLWEPVVALQTLNFKPYRVDLTPFAAVLSDGKPHTLGVSVYNANSYFLATGNLLLYTDHDATQVQGGLLRNTLGAAPMPVVTEKLAVDAAGTTTGTVSVGSNRTFVLSGYVNTSHGQVLTTIQQTVNFLNAQQVDVNVNLGPDIQDLTQTTTVDSLTTTQTGSNIALDLKHVSYPFKLRYDFEYNADGSYTQIVTSDQKNLLTEIKTLNGAPSYQQNVSEDVNSTDTLQFTPSFAILAAGLGHATASYQSADSTGACYSSTLASTNQALTAATSSTVCK